MPNPSPEAATALPDHAPSSEPLNDQTLIARARQVLAIEADAVGRMAKSINADFLAACKLILNCQGRLVVSGMGKSGHIANKLAATFASTGTPSFFVHPAEASHGDLGMITAVDVFLCLSNSGTTEELVRIVPLIKRQGARLIAMTGNSASELAQIADVHLNASVEQEACPLNLAPTASTTAALALGDALAVAVLEARSFSPDDFARSHPGGALGRRLLTRVSDIMHRGEQLPSVRPDSLLVDAIMEITNKRLGITAVTDQSGKIVGALTDGDLRRLLVSGQDLRQTRTDAVMTNTPTCVAPDTLAAEALRLMQEKRIGQLLVAGPDQQLMGALNFQDMLAAKIV
ncbi:MAG: KpsF/GutQ family sugar-phosphate isomerase [Burkholderiaceae bacterium]